MGVATIALLWCALGADEAGALREKAAALAREVQPLWERLVLEPQSVTDDELGRLIAAYDQAAELYGKAAELSDSAAFTGASAILARQLGKASMVRMARDFEARRKAEEKPAPKPEVARQTGEEPSPPEPGDAPAGPEAAAEPPSPERAPAPSPPPPGEFTKEETTRGAQSLRNFLMNVYFPNRRFSNLVSRCSICGGTGKVPTGVLDNRRRPVTARCGSCAGAGARLEEPAARRGYWLVYTPFHRESEANRAAFESRLAEWRAEPARIPEFLKSLTIESVVYEGLSGRATFVEKGVMENGKKGFARKVEARFVRIGRRWHLYDEATDAGYLRGE